MHLETTVALSPLFFDGSGCSENIESPNPRASQRFRAIHRRFDEKLNARLVNERLKCGNTRMLVADGGAATVFGCRRINDCFGEESKGKAVRGHVLVVSGTHVRETQSRAARPSSNVLPRRKGARAIILNIPCEVTGTCSALKCSRNVKDALDSACSYYLFATHPRFPLIPFVLILRADVRNR